MFVFSRIKHAKFIMVWFMALLTACNFAPPYERPSMTMPTHYQEMGKWVKISHPVTLNTNKPWWQRYHDPVLNQLEEKLTCSNQNLKVALARYEEALAIEQAVRSQMYPTLLGFGVASRQQNSKNSVTIGGKNILLYNIFLLNAYLTYEIDVWGRIRNQVAAAGNEARASKFDVAAVSLSLHASLASDYFKYRAAEAMYYVWSKRVTAYQKVFNLTRNRFQVGLDNQLALSQARLQLENAKTAAEEAKLTQAKLAHAIAVLVGLAPAQLKLPRRRMVQRAFVSLPPMMPSTLLTHRPDIAAAEQKVMAANQTIGVAIAAFFPVFNLLGLVGYQSSRIKKLFNASSLFWAIGPPTTLALIQPEAEVVIFDGFKLQAQLKYAKASYYEAASSYRQTVLTAFKQVEDALVAMHELEEEKHSQSIATRSAKEIWKQEQTRYQTGIVNLLTVETAENDALQSELAWIEVATRYQLSSVQLVKALGGGWVENGPQQNTDFK